MKQYHQRRIGRVIQPVDIDEIAIIQFPAFTPVSNQGACQQIGINGLRMAPPQPERGHVGCGAQRKGEDFHAKSLSDIVRFQPVANKLKVMLINKLQHNELLEPNAHNNMHGSLSVMASGFQLIAKAGAPISAQQPRRSSAGGYPHVFLFSKRIQ